MTGMPLTTHGVDYSSGAKLASMGMEIEKAKKRRLQLHGPEEEVAFDFTGMM